MAWIVVFFYDTKLGLSLQKINLTLWTENAGQIRSFLDMLWNLNYFPVRTIKGFVHNPTISKCVNVYCTLSAKIDDLSVSRYIWSLTSNLFDSWRWFFMDILFLVTQKPKTKSFLKMWVQVGKQIAVYFLKHIRIENWAGPRVRPITNLNAI